MIKVLDPCGNPQHKAILDLWQELGLKIQVQHAALDKHSHWIEWCIPDFTYYKHSRYRLKPKQ